MGKEVTMTAEQIAKLRGLAKAATPGPWKWWKSEGVQWNDPVSCGYDSRYGRRTEPYFATGPQASSPEQTAADAAFIAAANPIVVSELLDQLEKLDWHFEQQPIHEDLENAERAGYERGIEAAASYIEVQMITVGSHAGAYVAKRIRALLDGGAK